MRTKAINGTISVNAIAGSYVVLLGIDMKKEATSGLLGFAIERIDHTENERYWLSGFKTFEKSTGVKPGELVSTLQYPIQAFFWGDYTAKPNHNYTYKIVAIKGTPANLTQAESVEAFISKELNG